MRQSGYSECAEDFCRGQCNDQADATQNGNGGKVVVWADGATQIRPAIFLHKAARMRECGWVETSGKGTLVFNG